MTEQDWQNLFIGIGMLIFAWLFWMGLFSLVAWYGRTHNKGNWSCPVSFTNQQCMDAIDALPYK